MMLDRFSLWDRSATDWVNFITSGGHVLLLGLGFFVSTPGVWQGVGALVALLSLVAWMANYRRRHIIADTPTSQIDSAAQGYVELKAEGRWAEGDAMVRCPVSLRECLWYRIVAEEQVGDDRWREVLREVSDHVFALRDDSGWCLVDPEGAEVVTEHKRSWRDGSYRYREWLLLPRDRLYVLGQFHSLRNEGQSLDFRRDVADLLANWKGDREFLLSRFDLNRDGQIDLEEWEGARRAATREVAELHREARLRPAVHVVGKPDDGRLFLISNLPEHELERKFLLWGWFHLIVVFAGSGLFAWWTFARS